MSRSPIAHTETATDTDHVAVPTAALSELRRAVVRRRRTAGSGFDLFYRIYVTGLLGLFGFYFALGLVDDFPADGGTIDWVRTHGAGTVALIAALAVAAGLRSGVHGGPWMIDDAEVHHILLSPEPRAAALATPTRLLALRMLAASAVLGAGIGELASRQLPGRALVWAGTGALAAASIAAVALGAALITGAGRRSWPWTAAAIVLPVWAALDLWYGVTSSPLTPFGQLTVWEFDHPIIAWAAPVIGLVALLAGWRLRRFMSVERTHHRSRLILLIRFAIARQDIRSLLMLRRQLAFERPRARPLFPVPRATRLDGRWPALMRDIRSYARWPVVRVLRVSGAGLVAGAAVAGVWSGTSALLVLGGVALYLAAIEVVEPLGQEFDHPSLVESTPAAPGPLLTQHLVASSLAMALLWAVVALTAGLVALDWRAAAATALTIVPGALVAVAAGGMSIKRIEGPALTPSPELEGPRLLYRLLWPPVLTTAGLVPVFFAHNAEADGLAWAPPAVNVAAFVTLLGVLATGWIRYRDQIMEASLQAQGVSR